MGFIIVKSSVLVAQTEGQHHAAAQRMSQLCKAGVGVILHVGLDIGQTRTCTAVHLVEVDERFLRTGGNLPFPHGVA